MAGSVTTPAVFHMSWTMSGGSSVVVVPESRIAGRMKLPPSWVVPFASDSERPVNSTARRSIFA